MQMLTEETKNKWGKLLDECKGVDPIKDSSVRNNTIRLLENTQNVLMQEATSSADGAGTAGPGDSGTARVFDPMLISMIRRTQPVLVGNQMLGVQPMSGPTGLIFAMRTYRDVNTATKTEINASHAAASTVEADKFYSGDGASGAMSTGSAENLGVGVQGAGNGAEVGAYTVPVTQTSPWKELGFTIDKATVSVGSRALKARYTTELAQDLKAVHGLDAETELSTLLSNEIVGEIDRELIELINTQATLIPAGTVFNGADITSPAWDGVAGVAGSVQLTPSAAAAGGFDGRWTAEKAQQLIQFIGREASNIAKDTRRGRGNWILCSSDVAEYIAEAGNMNYLNSAGSGDLSLPDVATGPSFLGVLNGRYKVFVDPFAASDYVVVGYKGANVYDAGAFYCPYVPMQFMRAIGEEDFAPRIGFKTRYGLAANPFAVIHATNGANSSAALSDSAAGNPYFRKFTIADL